MFSCCFSILWGSLDRPESLSYGSVSLLFSKIQTKLQRDFYITQRDFLLH